jgi:hypothetical protein
MKQMKQMKQMQQESRCTLAGLSDDEALKMMQQMKMMHPCTLQRAFKGFKGCKMIRCTLEERKALEGLEKGLKDDAALKPCKHLEADADDDAPLKHLEALADARAFLQDDEALKQGASIFKGLADLDAPLQGLKPLQMLPYIYYMYVINTL